MSDALVDFVTMGGHGLYVWLAYGIGFAVLGALGIRPFVVRRRLIAGARAGRRPGGNMP